MARERLDRNDVDVFAHRYEWFATRLPNMETLVFTLPVEEFRLLPGDTPKR